jgi:sporulation protein YlmC with PRC-barrel domain
MNKLEEVQNWRGMKVVDADGDKIGTIEDVFLDRHTGEPEWATVKTGLFGLKSTFVPIREAQVTGDDQVRVPFQKDQVKNAPRIDADGKLSPEQERELWEYYGAASSPASRECGCDA